MNGLENPFRAKRGSENSTSTSFDTATPVDGSIYVVPRKTSYYAVIVLPLGDFRSIGLKGIMEHRIVERLSKGIQL